jgi:hypothetical protein
MNILGNLSINTNVRLDQGPTNSDSFSSVVDKVHTDETSSERLNSLNSTTGGLERAMSLDETTASDGPPSAIGAGATVSFNFNPAELFRVGKISKAIKAAFRNKVSPAAADALARQLERFAPVIEKLKNLGLDPSKIITMEIANPYSANNLAFDPKLVIALNTSELSNLLPGQIRDLAMTIGALTLPGSAEQNENVALGALLANAIRAPDGTSGPGDFRISITGDGYKFGTSYGREYTLGGSLSTFGIEAEMVAEVAPDGTRSLEFAIRLAEKRTITGDGQRDFPSGIDFGGAIEASISLNESDLFRTSNGQIYMRVTGGDGVVSVPLPTYVVAALGYDPAKLTRRELSTNEQTMDLQTYSLGVYNQLQQSLDPKFVAAMETIGRFLPGILAVANPFGMIADWILGNEGEDRTGVTRLPGGGRVINREATQAEVDREIIGRLIRGPKEDMDSFTETFVNRYLEDRSQFNKPSLSSSQLDQFRSIFKTVLEGTLDYEEAFRRAAGTINGLEFNRAPPPGVPDPGENPNERVRVWVPDYPGAPNGTWQYLYRPGVDGGFNAPDESGQWVWLGFESVAVDKDTGFERTGYVGVWGNIDTGEQRRVALAEEGLSPDSLAGWTSPSGNPPTGYVQYLVTSTPRHIYEWRRRGSRNENGTIN